MSLEKSIKHCKDFRREYYAANRRREIAASIDEQINDHMECVEAESTPLSLRVFYGPECPFDGMSLGKDDDKMFSELGID